MNPKNNSFVVPDHCETSIKVLVESVFVGMYFASSENKLFVPTPHTSTSSIGSPDTVKSNAMPVAFAGNCTGTQAIAGVLDSLLPSGVPNGCGKLFLTTEPGTPIREVKNKPREADESIIFTTACPPCSPTPKKPHQTHHHARQ